jgi:hypothetical protein
LRGRCAARDGVKYQVADLTKSDTMNCRERKSDRYRFAAILRSGGESVGVEFEQDLSVRLDFKERSIACLNWSRGYICSTAADSEPSATRSASFW